jgi:hypothetical protein
MYKTVYLVLAVYSGSLYFFYIPIYKYMVDNYNSSTSQLMLFSTYIWLSWVVKTLFGYISDTYFVCGLRIIPYVVGCTLVNIMAFTYGAVSSSKGVIPYYSFAALFLIVFFCFSFIDSVARKSELTRGHDWHHSRARGKTSRPLGADAC